MNLQNNMRTGPFSRVSIKLMVGEIALELAFIGCEEIHLLQLSCIDIQIHASHS